MNKKANILDFFFIIVILLMTAITVFVAYKAIVTVDNTGIFATDTNAQYSIDRSKATLLNFDNMMMFVVVGLSLFVLVSSAVVYNHPAFFFVGIFLLFIAVVVSAVFSNNFWIFSNNAMISDVAILYPKITFLMNKLPWYIAFMGIASSIVMYISYSRQ